MAKNIKNYLEIENEINQLFEIYSKKITKIISFVKKYFYYFMNM